MRIMLDTNVLISVLAFKSKTLGTMLAWICQTHQLVLSTYVVDECYEVVQRKKPALVPALDRFFEALPYELVHTPQTLPAHGWFTIRDGDDEKVLYSAITSDVDVLITGDKDFADVGIEKPDILTPAQFAEKYMLI
jgi:putative PIN family toxin of toxin-antitoxin system